MKKSVTTVLLAAVGLGLSTREASAGVTPDLITGAMDRGFSTSTLSAAPENEGFVAVNWMNFASSNSTVRLDWMRMAWGYDAAGDPSLSPYFLSAWSSPEAIQANPTMGDVLWAPLAGTGYGDWRQGESWSSPAGNPVEVEMANLTSMQLEVPANTNLLIGVVARTPDTYTPIGGFSSLNYGGPAGSLTPHLGLVRFFTGADGTYVPAFLDPFPEGTLSYAMQFGYDIPTPGAGCLFALSFLAAMKRTRKA